MKYLTGILIVMGMLLVFMFSPLAAQEDVPWPTDGWLAATPESQGMDSARLAEAYEAIQDNDLDIHSLLVIRHGYLVAEMYRYPYTADTLHDQRSITKSNTATMVGIAINDGAISGVDATLLSFFPNQTIANVDAHKKAITIKDMLTMSSGLDSNDDTTFRDMVSSSDWTAWMLNRPVIEEPGTRFSYSSGSTNLLAAIVEQASGQPLPRYASDKLYGPLGITNFQWNQEIGGIGHTLGGFGLYMTPRDMAKLGYLYLHHGEWDGAQIVPADWVLDSTSVQAPPPDSGSEYGYQWWIASDDEPVAAFSARGYGGQLIYIAPEFDLIVVFTAGLIDSDAITFPLIHDHIVPAISSDSALPNNPDGVARLQEAIDALQNALPQPVPELLDMAKTISGTKYVFNFAPFYSGFRLIGWKELTLTFAEGSSEAVLTDDVGGYVIDLPIGMDAVPRMAEIPGWGTTVMRGTWIAADTFVINLDVLGLPEHYTMAMHFENDQMLVMFSELLSGQQVQLEGEAT
ncbi:MAG: beta-lactamase family protein [Anaerolineae bacterium]|nr:beta-lactamase family protein [Anaerolineae bacterium]